MKQLDLIKTQAEGKLSCACGNADWKQFLYVSLGDIPMLAGCKFCGRSHKYDGQKWQVNGPPAPSTERN
jgi:hypothetical protein